MVAKIEYIKWFEDKNRGVVRVGFPEKGRVFLNVWLTKEKPSTFEGCDIEVKGILWKTGVGLVGEEGQYVDFYFGVPKNLPEGYYYIIAKIYKDGECIDGKAILIHYTPTKPVPVEEKKIPKWISIPILGGILGVVYYFMRKKK